MGNCLKREFSSTVWAGDDWCAIDIGHDDEQFDEDDNDSCSSICNKEQQRLTDHVEEMFISPSSSSSMTFNSASRELRIKVSKRKLVQLLGSAERLGLTAEQVINRLLHAKERRERKHHPSWCPNLQSIPEMN